MPPSRQSPGRFRRLRAVLERRQPDLTVAMEDVHKGRNFAALLRTADAVGVLEAHATAYERDRPHRGIAAGAGKWMVVRRHDTTAALLAHLRGAGLRILAAHPGEDAPAFRDVDYTGPTALLFGNELDGLSAEGLAGADGRVRIPMLGMVRSLNVSVAAGLLLYEAERQRTAAGLYERSRLDPATFQRTLFEWLHPRLAAHCRRRGVPYPALGEEGELLGEVPR
ncbi:MAG TPA: tRNA (guanosine(18)-2'-O)-methyltransferase TrmH [Longimicrobiales bacterium]|nr:tRNA (guanosine(18)-2'-O)-methyltransferase TrmH [Longimicrobiales bacterium]